jgi:hypothetical protein
MAYILIPEVRFYCGKYTWCACAKYESSNSVITLARASPILTQDQEHIGTLHILNSVTSVLNAMKNCRLIKFNECFSSRYQST